MVHCSLQWVCQALVTGCRLPIHKNSKWAPQRRGYGLLVHGLVMCSYPEAAQNNLNERHVEDIVHGTVVISLLNKAAYF